MNLRPVSEITDVHAPEAYAVITAAAQRGEWAALATRLDDAAAAYRAAPSVEAIIQLEGTLHALLRAPRETLLRWTEENPDSPWGWLALGMADTDAGKAARGTEEAHLLSDAQWERVNRLLSDALDTLHHALERGVQPGPALTSIGQAATILGVGDLDHAALLRQLVQLDPNWLPAWSSGLARSEPRWGGSVAAMDDLVSQARQYMTGPDLNQTLMAEYWWWRASWEASIEDRPDLARDHIRSGLEICPPGRMRAALLVQEAQILGTMRAPGSEITRAWQAVVDADPGGTEHLFDLALAWRDAGDSDRATQVLDTLAHRSGPDAVEAANWLGRRLNAGDQGFRHDPAAAEALFRLAAAQGPEGKLNLAELILTADPASAEGQALCQAAIHEGNGYGALPLARARLETGDRDGARAALESVSDDLAGCKYALARGLDEGWFGASEPARALEISAAVLPLVFHPYLSVLHMTLLSAAGDWNAARDHGHWLLDEMAQGQLDMPDALSADLGGLLAEIPKPGLGGLLKRISSKARLRMRAEAPDLWSV